MIAGKKNIYLILFILPLFTGCFNSDNINTNKKAKHTFTESSKSFYTIKKGTLLAALPNSATTMFIYRGNKRGFDYELLRHFTKNRRLKLKIIIVNNRKRAIQLLKEKKVDIVAGIATINSPLANGLLKSITINETDAVMVSRDCNNSFFFFFDLDTIYGYYLAEYARQTYGIGISVAAGYPSTDEILLEIKNGRFDAASVEEDVFLLNRRIYPQIEVCAHIGKIKRVWLFSKGAIRLKKEVDEFIRKSHKDGLIRILYNRYYRDEKRYVTRNYGRKFGMKSGKISPYDSLFKRVARGYGIDWLLIAALAYHESGFNPKVESSKGAKGLLQLMDTTLNRFAPNLKDPVLKNVVAGVAYLKYLIHLYKNTRDPLSFALAAFNAGPGHINDARALCYIMGRDTTDWTGCVRDAIKKFNLYRYYSAFSLGYFDGMSVLEYVDSIMETYKIYRIQIKKRGLDDLVTRD